MRSPANRERIVWVGNFTGGVFLLVSKVARHNVCWRMGSRQL